MTRRPHRGGLSLLVGLGLAAAAGFGWAFDLGPPPALKILAFAGAALVLASQFRMSRLPDGGPDDGES